VANAAVSTEVSPADIGQLYLELHHRLHRLVDDAMNANGLSMARAKVLCQLLDNGPMKQADIAAGLRLAARSITDTVDSLERDGLAERRPDPGDRRAWLVAITEPGRKTVRAAMIAKAKAMEQIFGSLTARQRGDFATLLRAIGDSVAPNQGEPRAR
jgi:DNA-binding MarR family transcriptional regulator